MARKDKANINELTSEHQLYIRASVGDQYTEVAIKLANLTDEQQEQVKRRVNGYYIALDVVVSEYQKKMQVISFQHHKADLALIALIGNDLFKWDGINVDMMVLNDGTKVHVLVLRAPEGLRYNRRRGIRVNIDRRMEIRQNDVTYNILVRDISYCGIGLQELGDSKLNMKDPFVLFLTENDGKRDVLIGKITGRVVRQEKLENGMTISGCITADSNHSFLQKYVATKQMELVSGKSKFKSIERNATGDDWKKNVADMLIEATDSD